MGLHRTGVKSDTESVLVPPRGIFGARLTSQQKDRIRTQIPVTDSDIIKAAIGISVDEKYQNRIILPSFDKNGKINYFTTRSFFNEKNKYISCEKSSKSIIFNELYVNWKKPIVLVESAKTHFKMIDYCNFVPILGSNLHKDSKIVSEMILNDTPEIVLMFDLNASEKQFAAAKMLLGLGFNIKTVSLFKNNAIQPDEMSVDDILECATNAQAISSSKDILKAKIARKAGE